MSRNGSSSCRALTALGVMLACLAALRVTSVQAEEVAEAWRSPFGRPRSVSVDTSDGSCWAATGSSLMHLAADGSVLSQTDGFWSPRSISANPADGSCWVADTANNEVVHLDQDGVAIVRLGGFSRPLSVSVNSADSSCWVADAGSDEVVHLSEDGTELLRIGCYEDPLSPAIERCFADPQSVSVNPTDNSCWIADTRNNEVVHLAADGTELLRVGCYEDPQDPAVEKCFQRPRSVSVNRLDGSCWVADTGNNYMVHLAEDGSLLWRGPCFSSPQCVSVSPTDGSCWIADTQNNHLVHLDAEGNQLLREAGYAELESVSVNPADGSCWVADTGNSEVVHAAADGTEIFREGYFSGPQSVSANEADNSCWVADTDNDRVVQLAEDGTEPRSYGPDPFGDSLGGPQSVSVNPADPWEQWAERAGHPEYFTCWIADTENGLIRHSGVMGDPMKLELGVGGFLYPRSVSANPNLIDIEGFYDGWQCWVADTYNGQVVQIFELLEDGEYIGLYVARMPQDFRTPESVSVNRADGSCWVADSAGNEVAHLAWDSLLDGTELFRKACFSHPLSVSANWTDGSCWVADSMNDQVVHLAEDGAGLWRGGAFAFPRSVCVDTKDGSCWVADTHNDQVVHLAEDGTELWRGGSFDQPYAVSVNAMDGSCWVADTGNDQVVHLVITEGPPRACFTAAPVAGTAPLQVTFTDQSFRNPTSWSWDFGDGGTSDEQHPSHEYVDVGVYEVTLTVSNAHGSDSETKPLYIKVAFSDLAADHWACDEVLSCAGAGIVSGYDDGSYQPGNPVTRDQMAVYISRALAGGDEGVPEFTGAPSFSDVDEEHWALDYVEYAFSQNVVAGYDDGAYHPEYEVTRDQMAVYVARSICDPTGEEGLAGYVPADPRNFPDVASDFWAYTHIEYCVEHGVVQGYDDGLYHPEYAVTRDQMAVYVARAFGLLE